MAHITWRRGFAPGVSGGLPPKCHRRGDSFPEFGRDISRLGYNRIVDADRRTSANPRPPAQRFPAHHRTITPREESATGADLRASLEARRELGAEYEGALVEGFIERLEETIDARVDARVAERQRGSAPQQSGLDGNQLALGIVTTALAIPLTAIVAVGAGAGLLGAVIVWIGIAIVNIAAAISKR